MCSCCSIDFFSAVFLLQRTRQRTRVSSIHPNARSQMTIPQSHPAEYEFWTVCSAISFCIVSVALPADAIRPQKQQTCLSRPFQSFWSTISTKRLQKVAYFFGRVWHYLKINKSTQRQMKRNVPTYTLDVCTFQKPPSTIINCASWWVPLTIWFDWLSCHHPMAHKHHTHTRTRCR